MRMSAAIAISLPMPHALPSTSAMTGIGKSSSDVGLKWPSRMRLTSAAPFARRDLGPAVQHVDVGAGQKILARTLEEQHADFFVRRYCSHRRLEFLRHRLAVGVEDLRPIEGDRRCERRPLEQNRFVCHWNLSRSGPGRSAVQFAIRRDPDFRRPYNPTLPTFALM